MRDVTFLRKAALMSTERTSAFFVNKSPYNKYRNSTYTAINKDAVETEVEACHLPTILSKALKGSNLNAVLMKIDIEGGEFDIIDRMPDILAVMANAGISKFRIILDKNISNF